MTDAAPPWTFPWESTQPTKLIGGVNFTTWPDLKWSRANSHIAALESRLREWHASAPVSVETVLRQDRQGIDFVARVPRGIPKHEWSLDLGDALHNFRSAFDAVAWGMAHFNDAKPTRPKRVTFPIFDEESKWDAAVKEWIGELLPEFQARLRLMQPFSYAPGQPTVFSVLHDLDIQDKHRDMLSVAADLDGFNVDGAFFEFEDHEAEANLRLEMYEAATFGDGVVLGTLHAGTTVKSAGKLITRPTIRVQLIHEGKTLDVIELLHQFQVETRRYLDILLVGLAPPEPQDGDEWVPLTVESSPAP